MEPESPPLKKIECKCAVCGQMLVRTTRWEHPEPINPGQPHDPEPVQA